MVSAHPAAGRRASTRSDRRIVRGALSFLFIFPGVSPLPQTSMRKAGTETVTRRELFLWRYPEATCHKLHEARARTTHHTGHSWGRIHLEDVARGHAGLA